MIQTIQTKKHNRDRLCNKQKFICIVIIHGNEKKLMKFAALSAKNLKFVTFLQKNLFNIDITDLYLLHCF